MTWSSFFKNPKTALVGSSFAILGGIIASVSAASGDVSAGLVITSALSALAGLGGNFFSSACEKSFLNKSSRDEILKNGDLTRAVGRAIFALILAESEKESYGDDREKLERIGNLPETIWEDVVLGIEDTENPRFELNEAELAELSPDFLTHYAAAETGAIDEIKSLTPELWRRILEKLSEKEGVLLSVENLKNLSLELHENFAKSLRNTLIADFAEDGKAYASLQLRILGEILFYVRETHGKLDETYDKLSDIEIKISDLRGFLDDGLNVKSEKFDNEFNEIKDSILINRQIIVDAVERLEKKTDTLIEGQETLKRGQEKAQEGIDEMRKKFPYVEIIPKTSFKGFHQSFPRVPNFFTGREKVLADLKERLKTEKQASFYGTHGLGKTRTAIEYALQHEKDYEYILFISATKGNFITNAAFVGAEISEEIKNAQTLEAKYNLFIEHLQKHPNWLIIIDNVEDVPEVVGKIPKHFAGNVIYTSNLPEIENAAPPVTIEAMTQKEAELALLRRKLADNKAELEDVSAAEREAMTQIIEKIGTLPIALNLAGAFIRKYKINFQTYLNDYKEFEDATFQNFDLADYYGENFLKGLNKDEKAEYKGIAGVFLLSYKRIIEPKDDTETEKQISQTLEAILNLSAFLAPEKVPEEVWLEGLKLLDENLAKAAENKLFWLEVRNRLTQAAFFVKNEDDNTSTTHRLILAILQKRLTYEEERRFAEVALNSVNNSFPEPIFENWKECGYLQRHVETALSHAENLAIETQEVARLYNQIAVYINDLAEYEKSVIFHQKALKISEKILGKFHPEYAKQLNNLGDVYQEQGRYDEAIDLLQQALELGEKTIGKEHPSYAIRLVNLAKIYTIQGKFIFAQQNNQQALKIFEKSVGKLHPYYSICLNDLANVYRLQDKYDEAVELYKQALAIGEKTIGKFHPNYAIRLNNLANVYHLQGKYSEALPLYEESLRIFESTLPENHPDTQIIRKSLEICRRAAGEG